MATQEVSIPPEVREKINERLRENDVIEDIQDQVKKAMKIARNEIKEKKEPSELLQFPLKGKDEYEQEAYQAVVKYLESRGLKFTLSTLLEESGESKPEQNNALDILEYMTAAEPEEVDDDDDVVVVSRSAVQNDEEEPQDEDVVVVSRSIKPESDNEEKHSDHEDKSEHSDNDEKHESEHSDHEYKNSDHSDHEDKQESEHSDHEEKKDDENE